MNIVPSINSKTYTLSAIIIGYLLLDESTPAEQNSLGNWFMLIGQVLCTNSAQQQVLNNRSGSSNQSNRHIINDDNLKNMFKSNNKEEIDYQINMMKKVINALEKEINNLKNWVLNYRCAKLFLYLIYNLAKYTQFSTLIVQK